MGNSSGGWWFEHHWEQRCFFKYTNHLPILPSGNCYLFIYFLCVSNSSLYPILVVIIICRPQLQLRMNLIPARCFTDFQCSSIISLHPGMWIRTPMLCKLFWSVLLWSSIGQTVRNLVREGGWTACYRGLRPKCASMSMSATTMGLTGDQRMKVNNAFLAILNFFYHLLRIIFLFHFFYSRGI